jgi:hypothetical protein
MNRSHPALVRVSTADAAPGAFDADPVVTAQKSASQQFVLDSRNRNQTARVGTPLNNVAYQPWNEFRLQRPEALMGAFARRITPTEIRLPWAVPNVNPYTNTFYMVLDNDGEQRAVTIPNGFYTPAELITAVNAAMLAAALAAGYIAGDQPTLAWDPANFRFSFIIGNVDALFTPFGSLAPTSDVEYLERASLLKMMGVPFSWIGFSFPATTTIRANTSFLSYTDYVDIVSEKLNYNADFRDGTSDPVSTPSLIARVYIADEVSLTQTNPPACRPFIIHRQFMNGKAIKWNPQSLIDWLDIAVYDQYGKLVPLIPNGVVSTNPAEAFYDYPDFQITLTASEH